MRPDPANQPIKITLDDLANIETAAAATPLSAADAHTGERRIYGNVGDSADAQPQTVEERGSIFLQGWVYLGLARFLVPSWGGRFANIGSSTGEFSVGATL